MAAVTQAPINDVRFMVSVRSIPTLSDTRLVYSCNTLICLCASVTSNILSSGLQSMKLEMLRELGILLRLDPDAFTASDLLYISVRRRKCKHGTRAGIKLKANTHRPTLPSVPADFLMKQQKKHVFYHQQTLHHSHLNVVMIQYLQF